MAIHKAGGSGGGGSYERESNSISSSDSPYVTSGEDVLYVDTSSGSVTVTLSSSDVSEGNNVTIMDSAFNATSNPITVNTEGSETIDPNGATSKSIDLNGAWMKFESDGTKWISDMNRVANSVVARTDVRAKNSIGTDGKFTTFDGARAGMSVGGGTGGIYIYDNYDNLEMKFERDGDYRFNNHNIRMTDGSLIGSTLDYNNIGTLL